MRARLAYGKTGLEIDLPDGWDVQVVEPRYIPGLADPQAAIQEALRSPIGSRPLAELVANTTGPVGIIINDLTRPTPNALLIQAILAELPQAASQNVILFIALGSHRENTPEELRGMLSPEIVERFRIVQNSAFDPATQACIGETKRGNRVFINKEVLDCPVRILTGFIEPHFFAGFSGGGKALMPGMAGQTTILGNHRAENIGHPKATWGNTWGNPIWEEIRESAYMVVEKSGGVNFLLNVTLNREKAVTAVFAGELDAAHARGVEFVRSTAMVPVDRPFDIVVTTNSGYPLDLNLYQAVKGMSAAAQVVREGGAILVAAECWDGIPEHGLYGQLLREAGTPQRLLDALRQPGFLKQDQWQAQIQAQIQLKADVYVYSGSLSAEQVRAAMLLPTPSVEAALHALVEKYGPGARICILPEGPQTVPYIQPAVAMPR